MTVKPTRSMSLLLILAMVVTQFVAFAPMQVAYAEYPTITADTAWFALCGGDQITTASMVSSIGLCFDVYAETGFTDSDISIGIKIKNSENKWLTVSGDQYVFGDTEYVYMNAGYNDAHWQLDNTGVGTGIPEGTYTAYIMINSLVEGVDAVKANSELTFTYEHDAVVVAPTATFTSPAEGSTITASGVSFEAGYTGDLASAYLQFHLDSGASNGTTGWLYGSGETGYAYNSSRGGSLAMAVNEGSSSLSSILATYSNTTNPFKYGNYTAYICATDTDGGSYADLDTLSFTVEYASPSGLITSPSSGATINKVDSNNSLTIAGTYAGTCVSNVRFYLENQDGEFYTNQNTTTSSIENVDKYLPTMESYTWEKAISIEALPVGTYTIHVDMQDAASEYADSYSDVATSNFTIEGEAQDQVNLTIDITQPVLMQTFSSTAAENQSYSVLGTVTGTGLDHYDVLVKMGEVAFANETGTSNIENGELANLDFTTMKDGQYTVYLTATGTDDSTQTVTETFTLDHPKAIYGFSSNDTLTSQINEASYGYYILKTVDEIGAYAEKDGVAYPINSSMATGASTSTVNYYWNSTYPDGQAEGGDVAPDGVYDIYIMTTSDGVATTSNSIPMRVDNTADEPTSFGTTGEITYSNANSFDATATFATICEGTTVWLSIMDGENTLRSQTDTVDANGDSQVAFTNTGTLSGSGTFTLKVDTTDLAGNTFTTSTSITIDTKAPSPTISADYDSETANVTLSWSNTDEDIDGYDIYEGTSSESLQIRETYYQPATTTGAITYSYEETTSGTHYYKIVPISTRYNVDGERGNASNIVSASVVSGYPNFYDIQQTYAETSDGAGNWAAYGLQLPVEMNGYATENAIVEIRNEYTDDTTFAMISGTEGAYYAQPSEAIRVGSYEACLFTEQQEPVSTVNFTIINNDHPVIYDRNLQSLAAGMDCIDVSFVYSGSWDGGTALSLTGGDVSTTQTDFNIDVENNSAGISLELASGTLASGGTYTFSFVSPANVEFVNGTDIVTATSDPILSGNSNPWAVPAGQSIQPPISVEMLNPDGYTTVAGSMKILDYNDTVVASTTNLETEADLEEGTIDITGNFEPTIFIAGNYTIKLYSGTEEVPAIYNPSLEARAEATVTDAEITSDGTNFYLELSGFELDQTDWTYITLDLDYESEDGLTTSSPLSDCTSFVTTDSTLVKADLGTTTPLSGFYMASLKSNGMTINSSINFGFDGEVPVQEEATTPGVLSTTPTAGETEVDLDQVIYIAFDKDVDEGTDFTTSHVLVIDDSTSMPADIIISLDTVTDTLSIAPTAGEWMPMTTYTAQVYSNAVVETTNQIANDFITFSFQTGDGEEPTPSGFVSPFDLEIYGWNGSDGTELSTQPVIDFTTTEATLPVGMYYWYNGGGMDFDLVPENPDGSIDMMDATLSTNQYTVYADLTALGGGTVDASYDGTENAWEFMIDINGYTDVGPVQIPVYCQTPGGTMLVAQLVAVMNIDPAAMDDTLNLASSTAWNTITDFTSISALTFDKYSTSGGGLYMDDDHIATLTLGSADNTINLCELDDSGNPVAAQALISLGDNMTLAAEDLSINTAAGALEAFNKPAHIVMYNLEYDWDPGIYYVPAEGDPEIAVEPNGKIVFGEKVADYAYDDETGVLTLDVKSWSGYRTFMPEMNFNMTITDDDADHVYYDGDTISFTVAGIDETTSNGALGLGARFYVYNEDADEDMLLSEIDLTESKDYLQGTRDAEGTYSFSTTVSGSSESAWPVQVELGWYDATTFSSLTYGEPLDLMDNENMAIMNFFPPEFLNGSTTDFSGVDLTSVSGLAFEIEGTGKIVFDNSINVLSNAEKFEMLGDPGKLTITPGAIGIATGTDGLDFLAAEGASLTMYGLPYQSVAIEDILYTANDFSTTPAAAYITSFIYTPPTAYGENNGVLVMSVSGFSTYSIEGLEPWTDSTAPLVTISADIVEDGAFTSTTPVAVTITVADEGGSEISSVSGVEGFALTPDTAYYEEYTSSCAADGAYSFSVTATDGASNTGSGSFGFTIDTIDPAISFGGVTDGQVTAQDLNITFSFADDNLLTTSAVLDKDGTTQSAASQLAITTDGAYTLTLTAEDAAGNISQETINFTKDSSAPTITIEGVAEGEYYKTNVTPTVTVTDSVSTSAFLNGSAYTTGTAISTEGEYTLLVVAENEAGTASSNQVSFTIDKTQPTVVISRDPSTNDGINGWYVTRPTITIASNEAAEISYTVDSGNAASYSEPFVIEEDGTFTINATATDLAGNTGTASSVGYKVDTIFPVAAMDALPSITSSSSLTVSGTITEANPGSMQVFLNGTGGDISLLDSGSYSSIVELTSQGSNEIYVRVKDKAGNVTTTSAQTVIFDSVAPTGNVSYDITGLTKENVTATLETSEEATITNNGGSSTFEFTTNESFTFEFADAAGNTGSAVATVDWIDKEAPAAPTITAVPDTTTGGSVTVSLSGIEEGATAYISTGGDFSEYTAPIVVEINNTTVTAYQVDEAENQSDDATLLINWIDKVAPVITLNGDASTTVEALSTYVDAGATATDAVDGSVAVTSESSVDTSVIGTYTVTYSAVDSSGNEAVQVTRTVEVVDTTAPEISIAGDQTVTVEALETYTDLGATAADSLEGEIAVTSESSVNTNVPGTYTVTYSAVDSSGNEATAARTVQVVDTTAPVITLNGDASTTAEALSTYVDAGATATDAVDVTVTVTSTSSVTTSALGTYTVTYSAVDSSGNEAVQVTRTVEVVDTTAPVITILGDNPASAELGSVYTDAGATAEDALEGMLTLTSESSVDTSAIGTYTVTYSAVDSSGNTSTETRTVAVSDSTAPDAPTISTQAQTLDAASITIEGTAEAGSTVTITGGAEMATGTAVDGSFSIEVALSQDAVNTLSVTATDASGNESAAATVAMTEDSISPTGTVTYSTETTTNGAVTATLETSEEATITNNGGSNTFEFTSNGSFTFEFADAAGNTGSKEAEVTWIDITAPVATITASPEAADGQDDWFITAPTVTISSNEDGEIHYTINDGTDNLYSEPFTLEDGTTTLTAWAVDQVGNTSEHVTETYNVDTAAPIISIGNLPDYVNNSSFTVSGLYSEANLDALGVNLNGAPKSAATEGSSFISEVLTLIEGPNTIYAGAEDLAGHVTTTSAQTVTVDTTVPVISGLSAAADGTNATVSAAVTEVNLNDIILEVDGSYAAHTYAGGNVTASLSGLADGDHEVVLTVTDIAGNTASSSATFTVDTIAPVVNAQIIQPDGGLPDGRDGWYVTSPQVSLANGESLTMYYNIDGTMGEVGIEYTAPVTIPDGTNQTFNYWANDAAGNRASGSLTFAKVDTDAPSAPTINVPARISDTTTTLTGTAANADEVILTVNGGSEQTIVVVGGQYSATVTIPNEGGNTLSVKGKDLAGNASSAAAAIVNRDTQGPNLAIEMANGSGRAMVTVSASEAVQTTPSVTVSMNGSVPDGLAVTDDGRDGDTYTYIVNQELSGDILIEAQATDAAGNQGLGSYAVSILNPSGKSDVNLGGGAGITFPDGAFNEGTETRTFSSWRGSVDDPQLDGTESVGAPFEFQIDGGGYEFGQPVLLGVPVDGEYGHFGFLISGERRELILDGHYNGGLIEMYLPHFSTVTVAEDILAPTLSFDQSFPALTNGASFTVSGDLTDNITATGSAVNFTVNGGASQSATVDPCAANETTQTAFSFTAALSEGENTISITASDMFGNERNYTRAVTLDTEAEVAITVPSSDISTKTDSYQVKGTAEAGADVTVTFAGSDVASFTAASSSETALANLDLSSKDDGTYVLSVTATDPAGNSETVSRSITRDTQAGLSEVDYPAIVTEATATVTGNTDDGDTLTATLNGSNTGVNVTRDGTSFSVALTGLSEGDNAVRLISTDELGNAKSQTVTINYDTDALFTVTGKTPGAEALNGSTYYTTNGAVSYTLDVNRSGTFTLKGNGDELVGETLVLGAGESQSVTLEGTLASDGTYAVEVTGTEPGDLNALTFDYAVVIDNTDPTVTLASGLATSVTNATFAISGTITDEDSPIAYYEIYRGNVKVKTVANPESDFTDSVTLASGENELTVMAYDAAGNFARGVHTVTYTVQNGGGGGSSSGGSSAVVEEPATTEEAIVFESKFTDLQGHWATDAIRLMEERGIANGMSENEFAPEATITRAQVATLLVRALGLDLSGEASAFGDVDGQAWYRGYVMAAYRAGLVNGMGDGSFAPEANITREQMAVMIMRAFNALENSDYSQMATDMGQRFSDQSGIAGWAYRAVLIANDMGIINGMTEDTFAPVMNATRAQAIVMLMRLLQSTGEL